MAKRTRGNVLLNAYMNRYVNDQASAVNSGRNNIQSAASAGASAISAVPTDLPELTDFSSDVYSGLLENEKQRQKLYEEAVKAAQAAAKKAARASSSKSGKSSKTSGSTKSEDAELPTYGTGDSSNTENTSETENTTGNTTTATTGQSTIEQLREKKDRVLGIKNVQKTLDTKQAQEESARATVKKGEGRASNYAAGRSGVTTSTDVGLASTYGAYAQARQAAQTKKEQEQYDAEQAKKKAQKEQEQARKEAEQKETYANLNADKTYAQQLAKPGVRLTDAQIKAVEQYLDEQPSYSDRFKEYQNGEITYDELDDWSAAIANLKQKTSFGGLGQDMQAFTSGLISGAVPFLEPVFSPIENALNDATGGAYNELHGGQGVVDTLKDYGGQSTVGNVAGQFAGNMALYGLANSALEGTALAAKAGQAGNKIAQGLSKIPGVGNLVTEGTGQAIGNILVGQGTDLALDTIPSLANDVYDYANGNPEEWTPLDIAGRTAANFGVNAAMNVGSEAMPAILRAGKNALQNAQETAARSVAETGKSIPLKDYTPASSILVDDVPWLDYRLGQTDVLGGTYAENVSAPLAIVDSNTLDDAGLYIDGIKPKGYNQGTVTEVVPDENVGRSVFAGVQDVPGSGAGAELQPRSSGAGFYEDPGIRGEGVAAQGNGGTVAADGTGSLADIRQKAQEVTGKSRKSVYTRDVESVFEKLRSGVAPEELKDEAARIAHGIVKESDFALADTDEAASALKDYFRNTQIRIDEKAASDILYRTGLKNIQQYNIQNGTKLSLTSGVPYNAALQELSGMNVGVVGDTVDDLLDAVRKTKTKPLIDTDLASAYSDYVQDKILAGADSVSESFDDWLERQGFGIEELPNYTQRVYDRWYNGDLPELQASVAQGADIPTVNAAQADAGYSMTGTVPELDGNLPATAVGAKKSEFDRSMVPNRDYAGQATARFGLDDEHASAIGRSEHQVWTDKEAIAQAADDLSVYMQQADGDFNKAMDAAISDLKAEESWNKGDIKTAQEIRDRLRTQFSNIEPGTTEYYEKAARYEALRDMISGKASRSGQNLQAFKETKMNADTGVQKMNQVTKEITDKWTQANKGADDRIRKMADELEALKNELRERDIADMEREAMQGMTGAQSAAGPQDAAFDDFLKEQGVKTDPTAEFDEIVKRVKEMAAKNNVKVSDEGAKSIAGKILAGDTAESYYMKLANEAAGITDLTLDEMTRIDDLYEKASKLPDSKERYELEQEALQIMASHLPAKSWFEKFDNIRYLAMLGNTRTHVRNVLGNLSMSATTKVKDEVAAAMQLVLPQEKRTKSLWTPTEMKDAARQYLNEQAYSRVLKDGGKYNLAQGLEAARKTYGDSAGGKILQKLTDLNSGALTKEDELFLEGGFVRSLASNLSAKGYGPEIFSANDAVSKGVLEGAVEQAISDAKEMTFHADNTLTKAFGTISKLGDKKGSLGQKIAYIFGSSQLPFAKTPANILKTSLEYTPIGGVAQAVYRGAKGQGAAAVTDALSKSVVGTGLMATGWLLAEAGLLNGSADDETGAYNETTGKQEYSVTIPGKGSYTIDFTAPSGVPLLMGANLSQMGIDFTELLSDENSMKKFAQSMGDVMMKALDPVTETSMLQSFNNTLENIRYADNSANLVGNIATDLLSNYAQQFVPTAFGQIARAVDPVRRSTYGGGDTQLERNASYTLQKTQNKIPGLSMTNEPYIDQWGREEQSLDGTGNDVLGFGARLAYNMFSPGYFSAENVTPVDTYIQDLYEKTKDASVIPQTASGKVNVNGEIVYMTPEQNTEYAKASGQLAYNMIDSLQDFSAFSGLSSTQQADIVSDVYSLAKKVGAKTAFPEYDSVDKVYQAYLSGGQQGAINYLLAKSATDEVKAQGNGASTSDIWNAANSLGLDESSTVQAFLAQTDGDSVSHRVYDAAGDSGVTAYMNAYKAADTDNNGNVSQSELRYALLSGNLDDVTLSDVYQAAFPDDEKVKQAYGSFGDGGAADWIMYYDAYNRQEKKGQAVAESLLDQLGYSDDVKAAFWRMTNSGWKDSSNPYA